MPSANPPSPTAADAKGQVGKNNFHLLNQADINSASGYWCHPSASEKPSASHASSYLCRK
jgi:hypothetical protein